MLCREVYKARDRESGKLVALKKVRMENEKEGVSYHLPWVGEECGLCHFLSTVPYDSSKRDSYPTATESRECHRPSGGVSQQG